MPSRLAVEGKRAYDATTETVGSTREQQAMQELKRTLGWTTTTTTTAASDAFLLRCLTSVHFSITEAVAVLKQRRSFEERLTSIRVTATVLALLRSGTISIIGRDVIGRAVLYISTQHFTQAALDAQDVQRLVIVVMEYMLAYCMEMPAHTPTGVKGSNAISPQQTQQQQQQQQQQQFIILINEEKSSWHANQSVLTHISLICSLISKYYPRLIGLVLLYEASWEVRHGIKGVFSGKFSETMRTVQMVTRVDIQKYVDRAVLPREMGGNNTTIETAEAFADAVLRHWYLKTSYLLLEDANTRPLWQLPPSVSTVKEWSALQRRIVTNTSVSSPTSPSLLPAASAAATRANTNTNAATPGSGRCSPAAAAPYISRNASGVLDVASLVSSRRSHAFRASVDDDDGFCSAISEQDDCGRTASSCRMTPRDIYLDMDVNGSTASPVVLSRELQRERELRMNAEQQLRKLRLGVTLDLATATELERTLAVMHAELNVLVANIAARARESAAGGSPPTLVQLLDLTLSALEAAANKAERVPAMKFAVPVRRNTTRSTLCCDVM
ncbi:CRAL-TRIO lipid binding domain [Trypanosoma melophagium]|uniref:CRAL-TRIO lipid binding domain n=1 Tax=Trypanosoma melophagium TaxID=715481 RepID=UPI00351A306D|nr:CRAL-TRIO lipid binding domain [Trypanosoma melophagium]